MKNLITKYPSRRPLAATAPRVRYRRQTGGYTTIGVGRAIELLYPDHVTPNGQILVRIARDDGSIISVPLTEVNML